MSLKDVVGNSGLALYPELAMLLFLTAFLLVAWKVFRRDGREDEEASRLPLGGDTPAEGRPS
ncbi:MAG: hypothetical protein AB7N76_27415 [Planctomycetota bacterium]